MARLEWPDQPSSSWTFGQTYTPPGWQGARGWPGKCLHSQAASDNAFEMPTVPSQPCRGQLPTIFLVYVRFSALCTGLSRFDLLPGEHSRTKYTLPGNPGVRAWGG